MKTKLLATLILTTIFGMIITLTSTFSSSTAHSAYASTGGSPGGKTNSPGDGANCTGCHNGTINNPSVFTMQIGSAGLSGGYVPGQTYTIAAGVSGTTSAKIGFEATAEADANNAKTGTIVITDATRTKTENGGTAATHTAAGTVASAGANAWSFDWTAPSAGTGDVTFYAAFNVTDGAGTGLGNSSGDQIFTRSFQVSEATPAGIEDLTNNSSFNTYPNPVVSHVNINSTEAITKVEIFNTSGQMIYAGNESNKIDLSKQAAGIYFVGVTIDSQLSIQKIIKK